MRGSGAEGSHKNNLALISRAHVARTLVSAVSTFVSRRLGLGFAANASIHVFEGVANASRRVSTRQTRVSVPPFHGSLNYKSFPM